MEQDEGLLEERKKGNFFRGAVGKIYLIVVWLITLCVCVCFRFARGEGMMIKRRLIGENIRVYRRVLIETIRRRDSVTREFVFRVT